MEELGAEDPELLALVDSLYAPMLALDDWLPALDADEAAAADLQPVDAKLGTAPGERAAPAGDGKSSRAKGKAQRTIKRRANPNKARDERQLELVMLRGKVGEMERQLAALRGARGARGAESSLGSLPPPAPTAPAAVEMSDASRRSLTETWRQLCMRQLHRRIKAERENARLKRALDGQLKVSSTIRRLLDRPVGVSDVALPMTKRPRANGVPPTDPDADHVIFTRLLAEADTSLREIDLVLEENGIFHTDVTNRGAKMRERESGISLDVFATSTLPFDFNHAASGVWKHYTGAQKHFGSVYEKTTQILGPNDDTIIENFAMEMVSSNARADFRLRQVVKRRVTAERVVIVWTTDCEPIEYMNKMTDFGLHERGYIVCRPPSADQLRQQGDSDMSTVLQVCYRISPYELEQQRRLTQGSSPSSLLSASTATQELSRANIDGIAQFVLSSIDLELKANQEHIESLLLEETTSHRAIQQTASV